MATLRRINQEDLRNHNLSVMISTILHSERALSRADIAKKTGLTKATISLLATKLLEGGILKEGLPAMQAVYGRPSTPLVINGGVICGIGIQVNTDGYGILAMDLDGNVIAERWIAGDFHLAQAPIIFSHIDDMLSEQEAILREQGYLIAGAGLALPGLVADGNKLLVARNLGWEQLDLSELPFISRLNVKVSNEANMAAISQISGYATPVSPDAPAAPNGSFIYVSTDIGIGGALVRNGNLVTGEHGYAGEFGHLSVSLNGPQCPCGRLGCLEAYAGRRSMVELSGIASDAEAASLESLEELIKRGKNGDPAVLRVMSDAFHAMVSALTSTINISDTSTVILGGLWARLLDEHIDNLRTDIQQQILARENVRVEIKRVMGVKHPALVGAAQTGLRYFLENPVDFLLPPLP
ncbi:ROK family transcriptional regulator [Bifidobacterium gallicum]|uniref:NagC family transcriptional regulator n=1 Tax=Bifidobacterium gallicum DSM 20093 = LMG 11596 TaxID=561180 RepID=D1NUY3_9BIFI|nr:ROK family transcriptional regulator [Bifidobacterium gallicum]EFA22634.1 ROK family protein [Bifidobacterium gallicum DSM 20093 = LMG 11596]KFI59605.1 NagC family transcriptional regulator [Bifidobacterium gallicum DSM 20093 = LMG 11596]